MTIDLDRLLNWPFQEIVQPYAAKDTMLYALGIGLGMDPMNRDELPFVYERALRAFPTMGVVLGRPPTFSADPASGINRTMVVHGEQSIELHRPLAPEGTIRARERVTGVIDKGQGRGALVYTERTILDHATEEKIATLHSTTFCRADGGFGGPAGPLRDVHALPQRAPDAELSLPTFPGQALLYRLNGDYNPLHADPDNAAKAGYKQPILHGLCTFGVAAHAILKSCCGYDPARLTGFRARFSAPVFPGETISVELWKDGGAVSFRAWVREREAKVLDNGFATVV